MVDCICKGMNSRCTLCGGTGQVCAQCLGIGYVSIEDREHEYAPEFCECDKARPTRPRLRGMTTGSEAWTFARMFRQYDALNEYAAIVQKIVRGKKGWGVMYGPPSRGKTYLCYSAMNALLPGQVGIFTLTVGMLSKLNATLLSAGGAAYNAEVTALVECDLLCLDEFWEYSRTEWRINLMRQILTSRSDTVGFRPTLLTTNRTAAEVQKEADWLVGRFDHPLVHEMDFSFVPPLRTEL